VNRPPDHDGFACPVPLPHDERIVLGHGGGGRLTADLIERVFMPLLGNPILAAGDDAAVLALDGAGGLRPEAAADVLLGGAGLGGARLALTTDAHVVRPLFFPGGDIGRLAVCGTVNDLAMMGARPLALSAAFVIEEGLPTETLARVAAAMRDAAAEAGVAIVAGDTKVAERGKVDGLYVVTAGLGVVPAGRSARAAGARSGDAVLLSGPLGEHGLAVLTARGELALRTEIVSDVAPLNGLVEALYASGAEVHALRDPTRGGLAAALNEIAARSGVAIVLEEGAIPIRPEVEAACEMLGFDPLHLPNEGKLAAFVPDGDAERALAALRAHPLGRNAVRCGRVEDAPVGRVLMRTAIGGTRIVDVPAGELLPRIC
jgi:hydrogenase expression/formation protein HypE